MGTSLLVTVPATTGTVVTAGGRAEAAVRADAASNGKRCLKTSAPTIAVTANAEIAEMMTLPLIGCSPTGACASASTGRRTRGRAETRVAQFGRAHRNRGNTQLRGRGRRSARLRG